MIRPLAPVRKPAPPPPSRTVDRNQTLTMNDGTVARQRISDGEWVVVSQSKPIRAGPPPRPSSASS